MARPEKASAHRAFDADGGAGSEEGKMGGSAGDAAASGANGLGRGALALVAVLVAGLPAAADPGAGPPASLRDTGLYADFEAREVDPRHIAFAPQYPLWTDGATKRRWVSLPPGTAIDASDPEAWVFPIGTRFWKEFAFDGRRVETRYLERLADGSWRYASYEWTADGREAPLAPERGRLAALALEGGGAHAIPAVTDCKVCHQAGRGEVLGFSALQLSPERDPLALHGEAAGPDLRALVAAGLIVGLPERLLTDPPRIAATTPAERAVLGYLHGNCGHCQNTAGPLRGLGLHLSHVGEGEAEPAVATTVGRPIRKPAPGQSAETRQRVAPGDPERSALAERMASRYPALQMPPLGTAVADREAIALVRRWIADLEPFPDDNQGDQP
jgi:hypothetical protein